MALFEFVLEDLGEKVLLVVDDLEVVIRGDTVAIETVGEIEPVWDTVPLTDDVAHLDTVDEKAGLCVQIELFDALDEMDAEPVVLKLKVVCGEEVVDPKPTTGEILSTIVAEGLDVTDCMKLDVAITDSVFIPIEFVLNVLVEKLGLDDGDDE